MLRFIKNNIYIIAGALCVIVICALYFTQNGGGADALKSGAKLSIAENTAELNTEIIYSAEQDLSAAEPEQSASGESAAGQSVSQDPASPPEPENIAVYITGEVVAPGVYDVPAGARVWQVLEQAGGFTELAAVDYINLADYVTDTQHIVVPSKDDPNLTESAPISPQKPLPETEDPLVNINTAGVSELQTLPGIGEQIAGYIIEHREQNGGFKSIDEIQNVQRIGTVTFDKIKDKITVG